MPGDQKWVSILSSKSGPEIKVDFHRPSDRELNPETIMDNPPLTKNTLINQI